MIHSLGQWDQKGISSCPQAKWITVSTAIQRMSRDLYIMPERLEPHVFDYLIGAKHWTSHSNICQYSLAISDHRNRTHVRISKDLK